MWPKKSSFLSKSKKKSKKNVNLDESGHAADNDNKVVPKNQETQTNPVRFVTSDVQAPPKRKSHRYRCCKKQHARDSTKSTDSQRESVSIWSCICSLLPCLCCLKAPKDDEKKSPKGSSKHCSDKGLPGSQHTDLHPRPSDATTPPPAAISKKSEADIGKVSAKSTVVMPMSLEDDATKPRENDKPCPCKGRPVWDEYLKPPKSKRRCRHCNKLT